MNEERNFTKRKRSDRLFNVYNLGDPGCPADYTGPFRKNIRAFLNDCAEFETYSVEGMPTWSITLEYGNKSPDILLLIVEESIKNSPHPHCSHCRYTGWNHHPVSTRNYHFIIPSPELEDRRPNIGFIGAEDSRICRKCSHPICSPLFNCIFCGELSLHTSIIGLQSHVLHGVLHSNGYGHLLALNGREKWSNNVSGRDAMDLWDRLCATLRARKVSLMDEAKKKCLQFRLLHSVAYEHCWFGRWGYKYGRGSFGISEQTYLKAIEAIRGVPLSVLIHQFDGVDKDVIAIIFRYQKISGHMLQNLGDLLQFMMELKVRIPWYCMSKTFADTKALDSKSETHMSSEARFIIGDSPCRWSMKRLDLATQVIIQALRNCEKKWMPRQDVRDAARNYIGDTGLLDFVLKSLGNRVVGGQLVRRALNPITKVLEYCVEDVNSYEFPSNIIHNSESDEDSICNLTRRDILRDIAHIYEHVLENYKPSRVSLKNLRTIIPTASRIILDTRHLTKDYRGEVTRRSAHSDWDIDYDEMLRVMCTVVLQDNGYSLEHAHKRNPPAELVVLPPHATIGDLKRAAQEAFRDTYIIMSSLVIENVLELKGDNEDLLFGAIESETSLTLEVSGVRTSSELSNDGADYLRTIECVCGTKDDDGERMVVCDICVIWQHSRCQGIPDMDAIPSRFLCERCEQNIFQTAI